MRRLWKGFWQVSKTERIGYLLLFVLLGLHLTIDAWGPQPMALSHELLTSAPAEVPVDVPLVADASGTNNIVLFPFNINTADAATFKRLGLTDRSIAGLLRFRSKGGKVRNEADFDKLFSLSDLEKQRLRPWVRFTDEMQESLPAEADVQMSKKVAAPAFVRVDINQADSIQLLAIPGIGPAFASRIVRYRERLGGFTSLDQLREVFGIDSQRYDALWPLVELGNGEPQKISLCDASEEILAAHPYIGKVLARRWVAYRNQRGCKGCADFQKQPGVDAERWSRLLPYLDCTGLQ